MGGPVVVRRRSHVRFSSQRSAPRPAPAPPQPADALQGAGTKGVLRVREAARGHCGQPPGLEEVRALQAGVLLRQSMPSRALEAGRAQAGVQGADGVLHLLGQRRPAAAHPVRLRVPGRGGVRARGVQDCVCEAPGPGLPRGLVRVPDVQAGLHGRDAAWPGGSPVGAAARPASRGRRPPVCAEQSRHRVLAGGPLAEAEALFRDVLATRRRVHGPNHENTLRVAGNLGSALLDQGKHSAAEAVYRDTLERQRAVLGPEHESTLLTAGNLAAALQNQGKYAEAEPWCATRWPSSSACSARSTSHSSHGQQPRGAAQQHRPARRSRGTGPRYTGPGPAHAGARPPTSLDTARTLAITLGKQGQTAEAVALLTATLATQQRVLGPGHPDTQKPRSVATFPAAGLITAVLVSDHQGAARRRVVSILNERL